MSRGLLRMDLAPLRESRDFRQLLASRSVTLFGTDAAAVALLVQAKQLTGSAVAVGLLGVAELLPIIVFGLYGACWPTGSTGAACSAGARPGWGAWPPCSPWTRRCRTRRSGRCTCWPRR